jgi:multidrug resistance efflux pump
MRRRTPLLRTVLVASTLLVAATAAALFVPIDRVVVADGALSGGTTPIYAPLDARVERVLVRAGDAVRAGDPLVVLESAEIANRRARAEAGISALSDRAQALEAQLRHQREVGFPAELQQADLDVERAGLRKEAAERKLHAQEQLRADRLVAELAYGDAVAERDMALVDQRDAQITRTTLEGTHVAQLAGLEAQLREARDDLDERRLEAADLARQEALSTIVSSIDGTVVARHLEELAGRRVLSGEELMRLVHGAPERFEGTVSDAGRTHVRDGLPVRVRVAGYPWLLHGTVRGRVAFSSERSETNGRFPIEVALEGNHGELALRDGMVASARILVEESVPLGRIVFERLVEPQ